MSFDQTVKERAYKLDPECWISYSGKPKDFKQWMDARRTASLNEAAAEIVRETPAITPRERLDEIIGSIRCETYSLEGLAERVAEAFEVIAETL